MSTELTRLTLRMAGRSQRLDLLQARFGHSWRAGTRNQLRSEMEQLEQAQRLDGQELRAVQARLRWSGAPSTAQAWLRVQGREQLD